MPVQHFLTIIYTEDVLGSVTFFKKALDAKFRHIDEEKGYAQLEQTGACLAFVNSKLMDDTIGGTWKSGKADGFELTYVTDNLQASIDKAVAAGATLVVPPMAAFWSKEVAYVKSPQGVLIEFCLPMQP